MERYEINKEIKMRSLVPMHTLILDLLNHEMFELDVSVVEYCYGIIKRTIEETNLEFKQLKTFIENDANSHVIVTRKEEDSYLVDVCENCLEEIFNAWVYCEMCTEKSKDTVQIIICIKCFYKHIKGGHPPNSMYCFYRYEEEDLEKFINRLETRIKFSGLVPTTLGEYRLPQESLTKKTKVNFPIT